jgi:DNA-binding MarR family transcriptional regulator
MSFAGDADARLQTRGLGRVHHRILYCAHFSPGITVSELLSVLDVRHQNIQRPLRQLVEEAYILAHQGPKDARIKQLYSSRKGDKLLEFVGADQRQRIEDAYGRVTSQDVESYFKVMTAMLGPDRLEWVDRLTSLDDPSEVV